MFCKPDKHGERKRTRFGLWCDCGHLLVCEVNHHVFNKRKFPAPTCIHCGFEKSSDV